MKKFILLVILTFSFSLIYTQESIFTHDGIERTYLLHLPKNYTPEINYPLIVAMHGGTGSAMNLQNQSKLSEKADEEDFIVVYPEGIKGGVNNIRTWNAGWCCGHAALNDVDDVGFINNLIDYLINSISIDSTRVYATGMSNGGYLAYRLACEIGPKLAAIAPVACSMSVETCNSSREMPIIHFHSYLDVNVRYEGGFGEGLSNHYSPPVDSVLNVWSQNNFCDNSKTAITTTSQYEHYQWSTCTCDSDINLYISNDGGHSWPGGRKTLLGDPTSVAINATDLMWEFFKQYSLECGLSSTDNNIELQMSKLYPNPTTHLLHTDITFDKYKLKIIDLGGNEYQVDIKSENTIDVGLLPKGIYFLYSNDIAGRAISIDRSLKL